MRAAGSRGRVHSSIAVERHGAGAPRRRRARRGAVVADERRPLVEQARVAGRRQVVAEREQRPEDDVAVRVLLAPTGAVAGRKSKACGQSPRAFCARKTRAARRGAPRGGPAASQEADRPLADVAGAPAAAGVLLEPAGREVVDERVVGEPREGGSQTVRGLASGRVVRARCRRARRRAGTVPEAAPSRSPARDEPRPSGGRPARCRRDDHLELLGRLDQVGEHQPGQVALTPSRRAVSSRRLGAAGGQSTRTRHARGSWAVRSPRRGRRGASRSRASVRGPVGHRHVDATHATWGCAATERRSVEHAGRPSASSWRSVGGRGAHLDQAVVGAYHQRQCVTAETHHARRGLEQRQSSAARRRSTKRRRPWARLESEVACGGGRATELASDVALGHLRVERAGHPDGRRDASVVGGQGVEPVRRM